MFERGKKSEERERQAAREALEATRAQLDAERKRLEEERRRLEKLQTDLEARQDKLEDIEDVIEEREDQIEELEDDLEDLEELESPEEVREVLDIVTERLPTIMKDVQSAIFSIESMEKMAEALGAYYRKLVESGVPENEAGILTRSQQARLNDMTDGRRLHIRPPRPPRPPRHEHPHRWTTRITRDGKTTFITADAQPEEPKED